MVMICATVNALTLLLTIFASLDKSVQQEKLLCFWNQFYASLDGSVQLEMLLSSWKQFYASLDRSVQQEMLLCNWKRFYVSLDKSLQQETLLYSWKRGGNRKNDLYNHFGSNLILAVLEWGINCAHVEPTCFLRCPWADSGGPQSLLKFPSV